MKRWLSCVFALILILTFALPASAAESNVIYDGNAGKFIFPADGDLFPNLKNVMPGDTLTQTIVVKNENSIDNCGKRFLWRSRNSGGH